MDLLIQMDEEGEYPILAITEPPKTSKSLVPAIMLVVEGTIILPRVAGIGMLSQNKSILKSSR